MLLVRLLEISEYGRYRQFMATAMFITSLAGFALSANLNYLIARSPERQAVDISNTCLLMLGVSVLSALIVVAGAAVDRAAGNFLGVVAARASTYSCSSISKYWCRTGWRTASRSRSWATRWP